MKKIIFFNTAVSSLNVGDTIIMESCSRIIKNIFKEEFFVDIPTHLNLSRRDFGLVKDNKFMFVCGSNLLRGMKLASYKNPWKVGILFLIYILLNKINNVVLVGVGWSGYKYEKMTLLEKTFLRKLLKNGHMHSVRDEYTKSILNNIGIENVINTGCITTWNLTEEHCKKITLKKNDNVVITFTDYNRDYEKDGKLLEIIQKNYKHIYFWPQGSGDLKYMKELTSKNNIAYKIIPSNYEAYDKFLSSVECDFIGTRLHGGIKALQACKRTIIIGIDNRAIEMRGNNLIIIDRNKLEEELDEKINSEFRTDIKLYKENIEKWKLQFKDKN